MSKVFLDISIGDTKEYKKQLEEYERAKAFLKEKGEAYGFGKDLEKLHEDQHESLIEIYNSDPIWKSKGPARSTHPQSLHAGRIIIELFEKACPKTCENFKALCTGEKGKDKTTNKPLHYKGNPFHRIQKGFVAQAGDITRFDGTGGQSIWGKKFNDEKEGLKFKFETAGMIAMANSGKNTNTSQFFFNFGPNPKLNGKYVIFGKIVEGLDVLKKIEEVGSENGTPKTEVIISDCGLLI